MKLINLLFFLCSLIGCTAQNVSYDQNCTDGRIMTVRLVNATYPLIAGQNILAGVVVLDQNQTFLSVTCRTINLWKLYDLHMWIGTAPTGYPQTTTGNPKVGLFPYTGQANGATSFTFFVNMIDQFPAIFSNLCQYCDQPMPGLYIMTHAVVRKNGVSETAWGIGDRITRGNWAMRHNQTYDVSCRTPRNVPNDDQNTTNASYTCETGIARYPNANTCFLNFGYSRWGWSNGPFSVGSYQMDIWVGAGQCDTSKGYLGGMLNLVYNSTTATIGCTSAPNYWFDKLHLYIGQNQMPSAGIAFGNYPTVMENLKSTTVSAQINGLSGGINVVAHFEVCKYV
jgi:hypothetical protein